MRCSRPRCFFERGKRRAGQQWSMALSLFFLCWSRPCHSSERRTKKSRSVARTPALKGSRQQGSRQKPGCRHSSCLSRLTRIAGVVCWAEKSKVAGNFPTSETSISVGAFAGFARAMRLAREDMGLSVNANGRASPSEHSRACTRSDHAITLKLTHQSVERAGD
jgi:hypothetical protein